MKCLEKYLAIQCSNFAGRVFGMLGLRVWYETNQFWSPGAFCCSSEHILSAECILSRPTLFWWAEKTKSEIWEILCFRGESCLEDLQNSAWGLAEPLAKHWAEYIQNEIPCMWTKECSPVNWTAAELTQSAVPEFQPAMGESLPNQRDVKAAWRYSKTIKP